MRKFLGSLTLGCLLATTPLVVFAQDGDEHHDGDRDRDHDRRYYDREHRDYHHWDDHEDRAYRYWLNDGHRNYRDWNRLRARDQASYWHWRHEHPDSALRIDVR